MLRGRPRPLHSPLLDSPIYIFELRLWWFPVVINSRFLRIKHFPASYEMYCSIFIMLIPNLLFCVSPMSHPVLSHQPPILVNYLASFFQRAIPGCALALLDTSLEKSSSDHFTIHALPVPKQPFFQLLHCSSMVAMSELKHIWRDTGHHLLHS